MAGGRISQWTRSHGKRGYVELLTTEGSWSSARKVDRCVSGGSRQAAMASACGPMHHGRGIVIIITNKVCIYIVQNKQSSDVLNWTREQEQVFKCLANVAAVTNEIRRSVGRQFQG